MKIKPIDYIKLFFDMLIKRPTKNMGKELRYKAELGGKNGYEVNGIGDYWGRYASIKKIVELAGTMNCEDDWFTFYFPAKKYNYKYSHQIGVYWDVKDGVVELEYIESSSQCGSYYKEVKLVSLESELNNLRKIEDAPEEYGYVYKEW